MCSRYSDTLLVNYNSGNNCLIFGNIFRSKTTGQFINKKVLSSKDQSIFYETVLAHGDGSIKNCHQQKHSAVIPNPIAFCICRYVDLLAAFYIVVVG